MLADQDAAQEILEDPYDRKAEYTYDELLEKIVDLLQTNNPALVEKKKRNIKPPQLQLLSSKKTLWVNFQEICTMMQRSPDHVYAFFMAELGTEGSIDGNQRLIIRGKYVPKYIESLLRKYVVEYVTCEMCRSPNTDLKKDGASRLYFCHCRDCGSSRSVAPIRSGYHATSRADRRAARRTSREHPARSVLRARVRSRWVDISPDRLAPRSDARGRCADRGAALSVVETDEFGVPPRQ